MIDESQIEYLLNGERAEADVLNRPLRQIVSATNDAINTAANNTANNAALLTEKRYDEIFEVIKDGNGFTRERDARLIFDSENATVSISPGLGKSTWFYYHKGRKIESSETLTYTLSEAEKTNGGFYLSFNKDGDLVNTGPNPDFFNTTVCFYVHYSNGEFIIEGDERHTANRDIAWHLSQHRTDGMVVYTLGSIDWTPNDENNVGIQITSTLVADEDLQHLITHSPTGEEPFSQILEGSQDTVRIPTLYYDGSIRYLADKKLPWVVDALKYNDGTTVKDVPDGKFVNYFLAATNCQKYPIKLIMGRKIFDSDEETVDETLESLGLNFPEMALLYRISLERDDSLSTVGKCKLKSVQQAASKIIFESTAGSTGSNLTKHSQLLGRNEPGSHPMSAITGLEDALSTRVKWVSGDKIITVADSGADFTTVMGAVAEAMKWRSIDGSVIVEIQSGYLVQEQLFFVDNDYSHINIKAQNGATIIVDHNSMSVTDFEGSGNSGFIVCARGKSPMFQTQFEFLTRPANTINGALAVFNGEIYFGNNSGVKGAGNHGAVGQHGGSVTMGEGNNFSGVSGAGYSFHVALNGLIRAGEGTIFTTGRERSQAARTITANGLIMG